MNKRELIEKFIENIDCKKFRALSTSLEEGNKGMYIILKYISKSENEVIESDIAKMLGVSIARITVAIKIIEKKGYVIREKSKIDKRKTTLKVTEQGNKYIEQKQHKVIDMIDELTSELTEEECLYLVKIASKINK